MSRRQPPRVFEPTALALWGRHRILLTSVFISLIPLAHANRAGGQEAACKNPRNCENSCVKGDQQACASIEEYLRRLCDEQDVGKACTHLGSMYGEGGPLRRSMELWARYSIRACELGDGGGCNEAGVAYAQGLGGVTKDDALAVTFYKKACELGDVMGCRNYGGRLAIGRGVVRDAAAARLILGKACDANDAPSCTHLGNLLEEEHEAPGALRTFEKACRLGDPQGCNNVLENGGKVDTPVAWDASKDQRGCDVGLQQDCWELARDYRFGRGVSIDLKKAYDIATRSCEAGWPHSCASQASMLEAGEGVASDFAGAVALLEKACQLGDPDACLKAGNKVWKGNRGVGGDPQKAIGWYERGCKQNNPGACLELGDVLDDARVDPRARAFKHALPVLTKACDAQVGSACEGLGRFYRTGRGVPKDARKAQDFSQRACDLGSEDACRAPPAHP